MKIKILEKGPMIMTGSKVMKAIMNNSTPPVDIFVREAIQNSADAINKDSKFGRIVFKIDDFCIKNLCNELDFVGTKMADLYSSENAKFISISDSFTSGLLGKAEKDENGGPNNLYNLVYDFMNDKEGGDALGGSMGMGKSVYYRYGNGLCIYYSRTFEGEKYVSKLAATLIQNEKEQGCLLGLNSSGIAYFGNVVNNKPQPVYDEDYIQKFLSIFGLNPYTDAKTGTIVIIPFFDIDLMLNESNCSDSETKLYWKNDIESTLSMAIQRWYFPRIDNENFNGKYLKIAINGNKLELCDFFQKLQELYNGVLEGSTSYNVQVTNIPNATLGVFRYKLFAKEELGVKTPPINNPSPRYFVDSPIETDTEGLLFYTRSPGMIINYNNENFGSFSFDDDHYLIGVFILNGNLTVSNEILGDYIRKTEIGDHMRWNDSNLKEFPILSKRKVFKRVCLSIKNHLNEVFKKGQAIDINGSASIYQKKLGALLMPPLGYGDDPSIPPAPPITPPITPPKKRKQKNQKSLVFNGFDANGNLNFTLSATIIEKYSLYFSANVQNGSSTMTFNEWEEMGFKLPFSFVTIKFLSLIIDDIPISLPDPNIYDQNFPKKKQILQFGDPVIRYKGYVTNSASPYGFAIENKKDKPVSLTVSIVIKPISNKYSINLSTLFVKGDLPNE